MNINTKELEKISSIRRRLDACLVNLFSLAAINKLEQVSEPQRKTFVKARRQYGLYVAEFRNQELAIILNWLQSNAESLSEGITELENVTDDFIDLAETISAIAAVVGVLSSLIVGLPIP